MASMIHNLSMINRCFLLLGLLLLHGCAVQVSREAFSASRGGRSDPVIIDVRTRGEYDRGHIPGAVHIPVLSLPFHLDRVPVSSRNQEVVVYCAHGPRAVLAAFFLKVAGFSNLRHLQGNFVGWEKAGYPVEKSEY
ncbi:MAG: rhodanese-like domain-containing protein [Proteobacteria bacterium]|nr:rhodanese-like domain-containing protein [Pseudomonadota bacterium]MBU1739109.1 rhodanese-like domain-containing protein [Pseudomonadota bacterium]